MQKEKSCGLEQHKGALSLSYFCYDLKSNVGNYLEFQHFIAPSEQILLIESSALYR